MRVMFLLVGLLALVCGPHIAARADDDDDNGHLLAEDFREYLQRYHSIESNHGEMTLYVMDIRGRRLLEPVLLLYDGKDPTSVTRAKEGELLFDEPHKKAYLRLKDARTLTKGGSAHVKEKVLPLDFADFEWLKSVRPQRK